MTMATPEFVARVARAQSAMAAAGLGALLLSTEADLRYFTGFLTRFWESPTRPWYLVVPGKGDPIAVIPSIGAALMGKTWIRDIRTWVSPDLNDDGVSLLIATLQEVGGDIGMPFGLESHARMPLAALAQVQAAVSMRSDQGIVAGLRAVKSADEIAKITESCAIAGRAFARVGEIAGQGVPLSQVFRNFQRLCLEEGADWVPYLAGGVGLLGYDHVISPATDAPLQTGEVLMLDTGLIRDGYFCDFDRNYVVGAPDPLAEEGYACLLAATDAGRKAAQVGAMAADVFHAMADVIAHGPSVAGTDPG
ncbi:MAG: M24 family metallopeptidase, partial [Octadecabacter sp.]